MALILCIETATKVCSAAIFENGNLIDIQEEHGSYSHAENLAIFVEKILKENDLTASTLNAIAISSGPGSYTGLRIGTAFAKGLCYALNIPLIAIDTLKSMVMNSLSLEEQSYYLCPMIDARRMEVYTAVYNSSLELIHPTAAKIIEPNSFLDLLEHTKVYFLGDGALKCEEIIKHNNAVFLKGVLPSARKMGMLAFEKWEKQNFESTVYFEPHYLKEFIAIKGKKLV